MLWHLDIHMFVENVCWKQMGREDLHDKDSFQERMPLSITVNQPFTTSQALSGILSVEKGTGVFTWPLPSTSHHKSKSNEVSLEYTYWWIWSDYSILSAHKISSFLLLSYVPIPPSPMRMSWERKILNGRKYTVHGMSWLHVMQIADTQ